MLSLRCLRGKTKTKHQGNDMQAKDARSESSWAGTGEEQL